MNLTLRLSTKLIALQSMVSIELGQSSKSGDRSAIFVKGVGFQIETQCWGEDFNLLLFFLLFWDGIPAGQIVDAKAFCAKALPLLSAESIAHFDRLKFKKPRDL